MRTVDGIPTFERTLYSFFAIKSYFRPFKRHFARGCIHLGSLRLYGRG